MSSPKFHDSIFTLEEYMDWYAAENKDTFSYYEDWTGYNVPSSAFRPFYKGEFDPLSEKEKQLLRLFRGLRGRFYVIAVFDADRGHSLKHELAHALYFIDDEYKMPWMPRCAATTPPLSQGSSPKKAMRAR